MADLKTNSFSLDPAIAGVLACPVCHGDLRLADAGQGEARFTCVECERGYPVVDGIPVLIGERAERPHLA